VLVPDVNAELWSAIAVALTGLGGTVRWAIGRWERGQQRVADELFETRVLIAALLERERIRDARRRRDSDQPRRAATPRGGVPVGEFDVEESTDIVSIMDRQREVLRTKAGERKPRAGTHHDEP
jgi:hypothetical protein